MEIVDGPTTWRFDIEFLRSRWTCLFGRGCLGILDEPAESLGQGCCSVGAELDGEDEARLLSALAACLEPERFEQNAAAAEGGIFRDDERNATRVVDGACIFLNRPGFEGGVGCALHIAALDAGERPLDWKPNVCWQVPIRLEHSTDDNGHVTSRLREWKRRDWGEGGDDFHWWCTEAAEAFSGREAVYIASRDEIVELVGKPIYDLMVEQLERPDWVPLPHPTLRR